MEEWLIQTATNHIYLVYFFIIIFASSMGPILAMVAGLLVKLGYLSLVPVYAVLMFGDLLGDSVWYWLGKIFGLKFVKKFGKYVNITEESVLKLQSIFHDHSYKILFISKITNGFGLALVTLFTAGMAKIPFLRYLSVNLVGQFVWSGLLLAVGYFFGNLYVEVNTWLSRVFITTLFIFIACLMYGFTKHLRTRGKQN
jgi:membrane-associated protein